MWSYTAFWETCDEADNDTGFICEWDIDEIMDAPPPFAGDHVEEIPFLTTVPESTGTSTSTSQTTTASTSTESATTTTGTTPVHPSDKDFGDSNRDGIIDAKDASAVLTYYALASTATGDVPTLREFMLLKKA